jgi:hypothetical protein
MSFLPYVDPTIMLRSSLSRLLEPVCQQLNLRLWFDLESERVLDAGELPCVCVDVSRGDSIPVGYSCVVSIRLIYGHDQNQSQWSQSLDHAIMAPHSALEVELYDERHPVCRRLSDGDLFIGQVVDNEGSPLRDTGNDLVSGFPAIQWSMTLSCYVRAQATVLS